MPQASDIPMKTQEPTAAHAALFDKMMAMLKEHCDAAGISSQDLLAICAQIVGRVLAMQDQRTMTPDMAMSVVIANIERGNADVIAELLKTGGSA